MATLKNGDFSYLIDKIRFNEKNNEFELSSSADNTDSRLYFSYELKPYQDYDKNNFLIFIFFKNDYSENDIFQVYEKDENRDDIRIGWIFPIQSLSSNQHDFADNQYFLKYAFVAYQKLLLEKEIDFELNGNYNLNTLYKVNSMILILDKDNLKSIINFNLKYYLPSFYRYGYFTVSNRNTNINFRQIDKRVNIQSISKVLQNEDYIFELYKELIFERHPLVKFHVLYQIIELLIEKVLYNGVDNFKTNFENLLQDLKSKTIDTRKIQDEIGVFVSEKDRIKKLFYDYSKNCDRELQKLLSEQCSVLLDKIGKKEDGGEIEKSLYSVRNLIVHNYRVIQKLETGLLMEINSLFEILVSDLLINYKEEKNTNLQ